MGFSRPVWVLVAASYGLLVLGLFYFIASLCMNMNEFQFGKEKKEPDEVSGIYTFFLRILIRKNILS